MPLFNIKSSFFKAPRHQRFQFNPRYYDPDQEELEQRIRLAEREGALQNSEEGRRELKIKNQFRRVREKSLNLQTKQEIKKSRVRFLLILATLVAAAAWIIFSL